MDKNKHIEGYLDFYCGSENHNPFAVMLKGEWGCGKTFFIRDYIKKYNKEKLKFVHISLYGLSSFEEVNSSLVKELISLNTKKTRNTFKYIYKLFKNFTWLKQYVNIDFDEIFLDLFKSQNKIVFIFDDLERCHIKIDKVLGYINHFVEFNFKKVIIIANETEILKNNNDEKYLKIKEKIVGKDFTITPEYKKFIKTTLEKIQDDYLLENSNTLKKIGEKVFGQSGYNNLRLLQQAIYSFDYFFINIKDCIKKDPVILEGVFYEFLVIYIEYKKGEIKIESFFNKYPYFFKDFGDEKKHFLDKYDNLSRWLTYFDVDVLGKIFKGKILNTKDREKMLNKIRDISDVYQDPWKKLWYLRDYSDEDFFDNLEKVSLGWENKEYEDFFVLLHVLGMLLNFSNLELISKDKNKIVEEFKEYFNYLLEKDLIPLDLNNRFDVYSWKEGYYGLGYHGTSLEEWKRCIHMIEGEVVKLGDKAIKTKIEEDLLPILREGLNPSKDIKLLINYNLVRNLDNKIEPFFSYINPKEISKILTDSHNRFIDYFGSILEERYSKLENSPDLLKSEKQFLDGLIVELEKYILKIQHEINKSMSPRILVINDFIKKISI